MRIPIGNLTGRGETVRVVKVRGLMKMTVPVGERESSHKARDRERAIR
jgi:hypothetical protein